ncbi:bifunctional metallophosphatase/5'-nucleotidase [Marinicella meishanensis]|uniref:bifunctional metallophosphatase/5'-nucleotidase n=1 Tax=Marinicella meishanensis TaxID=2873263 RepID=UPI001CBD15F3|nr:5'-nucleotidase C-terminal domain-containing protein [Marinicella sp. NBU2979]
MSINDVYRIAGIDNGDTGGLARVRALRQQLEQRYDHVLFLHAGDFLHPSFISKQDDGVAMIQTLNRMDGAAGEFDPHMVVTWGNHEFDKGRMRHVDLMNGLLDQSEFIWLGSNIQWQANSLRSERMSRSLLLPFGDLTVGLFSHTTDIAHPEYIESFGDFQSTAELYVPQLRAQGADLVIGLTHQWLPDDLAMMRLPEVVRPDVIFGGHEHYVQTEQMGGRWILKADADAASAIVAEITIGDDFQVTPQVVALDKSFTPDPTVLTFTQALSDANDLRYCQERQMAPDCLAEVLSFTHRKLMAEETEIRRFETNLGNLLADMVNGHFQACQADVVLLNSGSIRLNQNIPAGSNLTVKHLEEMFPYPSDLRLIEFDRSLLPQILAHSISSWTANGHWLQVSGLAFIHDPEQGTVGHIHLTGEHDAEHEHSQGSIRAVVPHYLISAHTDHDGYTMIDESMQVACEANGAEIKDLFKTLLQASPEGIDEQRDFRICNTMRDPCR